MTDRLSLANALADAKIDRPVAERIATEIFEAIHDSVATKADLQAVRIELKAEIEGARTELKAEIEGARTELKTDIEAVRTALKADIAAVKADLCEVELRLETRIDRVVVRLGSLVVVVAGVLFAALRYLPPPH